jgi:lipopolysaccharide/colanic/teichoic acid biosynthesis glycosyltransferase
MIDFPHPMRTRPGRTSLDADPRSPTVPTLPHPIINAYVSRGRIFASIGTGLCVSEDGGQSFALLRDFPGATYGLRCLFVSGRGDVFVSPDGPGVPARARGLWRGRALGASWERVLPLGGQGDPTIWGFAEDSRGHLFAGTYTHGREATLAVVYRSRDGGGSWSASYSDPSGRHVHAVAADPWRGAVYACVGDDFGRWKTKRVVRTLDGGESWEEILGAMPQTTSVVATPTARLFGSDKPGLAQIYRTTDDERFEVTHSDEQALYFFWLRRASDGGHLFAGGVSASDEAPHAAVYRSTDDGRSWHVVRQVEAARKNDGSAFASNAEGSALIAPVRCGGRARGALFFDLGGGALPTVRHSGRRAEASRRLDWSLKNLEDKVLGALFFLVSLPVIIFTAALVKLTSPGPAFFRQYRHGLHGKKILVYKLRTMCAGRVTPVGRVLRATSLDELPQLYNVLCGDMSLVGPRPHPVELNERYEREIKSFHLRHSVRPGMTGLAQISGARGPIRSRREMRRRVAYDLKYVAKWSIGLDLKIIARTISGGLINREGVAAVNRYEMERSA